MKNYFVQVVGYKNRKKNQAEKYVFYHFFINRKV